MSMHGPDSLPSLPDHCTRSLSPKEATSSVQVPPTAGLDDLTSWEGVIRIAAGSHHTVGLTADGRVLTAGDDSRGQGDVGSWRDVIAVAAGSAHTLGLRADGTVLATGSNYTGQCDTAGWELGIPVTGSPDETSSRP